MDGRPAVLVCALAIAALGVAALPAMAQPAPAAPAASREDPFEGLNRGLYAVNHVLDRALFRPIAMTWRRVMPRPIRKGAHNLLGNLGEPIVFANDVLQLRIGDAGKTAARFVGNSTIGVLGIFDVASGMNLPHHENNFGFTLGRLGVGAGPYIFVPALGPSTLRGLVGLGVDLYIDPINQVRHIKSRKLEAAQVVTGAIDERVQAEDQLHEIETTATDPYATLRSVYLQDLESQLRGGDLLLDRLPELPEDSKPAEASGEAPVTPKPPEG